MRQTTECAIFTSKAEALADYRARCKKLHDAGFKSKRFETVAEAVKFLKDSHPFIAELLRRSER